MTEHVGFPSAVLQPEAQAVRYVDDEGQSWLLPLGSGEVLSSARVCREVTTERDLFHCAGTFYELPARNAGGFAKLRPIASHPFTIQDYASWRGLLVLTGVAPESEGEDPHVIRSEDGQAAVWLGAVDDLWKLGKPRGYGGPWSAAPVLPESPSLPFLMAGFDRKRLELSHGNLDSLWVRVEVDITGEGNWQPYRTFEVPAHEVLGHEFPRAFQAYWVRLITESEGIVTSRFQYD